MLIFLGCELGRGGKRFFGGGFFGAAYFSLLPGDASLVQENNERVFIVLSSLLFNPWIAGLLMSAILAAVMSTLSCQLHV